MTELVLPPGTKTHDSAVVAIASRGPTIEAAIVVKGYNNRVANVAVAIGMTGLPGQFQADAPEDTWENADLIVEY